MESNHSPAHVPESLLVNLQGWGLNVLFALISLGVSAFPKRFGILVQGVRTEDTNLRINTSWQKFSGAKKPIGKCIYLEAQITKC